MIKIIIGIIMIIIAAIMMMMRVLMMITTITTDINNKQEQPINNNNNTNNDVRSRHTNHKKAKTKYYTPMDYHYFLFIHSSFSFFYPDFPRARVTPATIPQRGRRATLDCAPPEGRPDVVCINRT